MRKSTTALALIALLAAFAAKAAEPVNINTAEPAALAAAINGVGLKKAEAIVAYRNANGAFRSVDELAKVQGIGAKTIERSRANLTVEGSAD